MMSISDHRWVAKALSQKAISKLGLLPLYHVGQKIGGRLKDFSPTSRMEYAGKLAKDVGLHRVRDAAVVEIGTGWVPVVPTGLWLLGAQAVHSFDLSKHLQMDLVASMAKQLMGCVPDLASRSGADIEAIYDRLDTLRLGDPKALLDQIGFQYRAPFDFSHSEIATASVDIVYSNLVLEHVTPDALREILRESRRILKPGGVAWHNVDFTDHYSHTHRGLSHVNFLRYGRTFWRYFGQNDILYLNRMRRADYARAFTDAGFEVEARHDHTLPCPDDFPVHKDYAGYDRDELTCSASRFVLRRNA